MVLFVYLKVVSIAGIWTDSLGTHKGKRFANENDCCGDAQ
jgi:hypothetical protein